VNCQEVQTQLSLYLYGELEFAQEEQIEQHLDVCALCQLALDREKTWHSAVNAERIDVPLEFLAECRRNLRSAVSSHERRSARHNAWLGWLDRLGFAPTAWSMRVAVASFLVLIGFSAARWMDRIGIRGVGLGNTSEMALLGSLGGHIRDIQPDANCGVRILVEQVSTREISGQVNDEIVRQLLLAAMRDPTDPGIRVDSAEVLEGQGGADVRDTLIDSVQHDPNAAVRLKALAGLRRFSNDPPTRDALKFVLEHDDNPGVRSEAINILAPADQPVPFNPDLAATLQQVMRAQREDDYVRARCMQMLAEMKASLDLY
jgi:hypothetical protein